MKLIYINSFQESYHPCEVLSFKYNAVTKKYVIYFFDCTMNDYFYAYLINKNGSFLVDKIDYINEEGLPKMLLNGLLNKVDVSILPPYIPFVHRKNLYGNEILADYNYEYILKKKIDFLEIESYEDALNYPKYHYFIIEDMEPSFEGFKYVTKFVTTSNKPLKKRIIARHKMELPISDFKQEDGSYLFQFGLVDNIREDTEQIGKLVTKIIELNKGKRENMDSTLLTKMVRLMLESSDRRQAFREYQNYLHLYYDKWILENKEKQL